MPFFFDNHIEVIEKIINVVKVDILGMKDEL